MSMTRSTTMSTTMSKLLSHFPPFFVATFCGQILSTKLFKCFLSSAKWTRARGLGCTVIDARSLGSTQRSLDHCLNDVMLGAWASERRPCRAGRACM
jgi:hypothetical protein